MVSDDGHNDADDAEDACEPGDGQPVQYLRSLGPEYHGKEEHQQEDEADDRQHAPHHATESREEFPHP